MLKQKQASPIRKHLLITILLRILAFFGEKSLRFSAFFVLFLKSSYVSL